MAEFQELARNAGDLAVTIFRELFPHDETLTKPPSQRWNNSDRPKDEDRFAHVESLDDVQVGDLLYVVEADSERRNYGADAFSNSTAREALAQLNGSFMVVTGKRGKTMIEAELAIAPRGGWDTDLTRLGEMYGHGDGTNPVRMRVGTARSIANLGKPEELRARVAADERFPQWQAAFKAAKAEEKRAAAKHAKEVEERAAREKPLRDAADRVNALAGEKLVTEDYSRRTYGVRAVSKWLAEGDRMRVYLAGLAALGRIAAEERDEILGHLATLGLITDTTEGEQ